jgi:hypothetical protein
MQGIGQLPGTADMSSRIDEWKKNAKQFMIEKGAAKNDRLPYAWVSTLTVKNIFASRSPLH